MAEIMQMRLGAPRADTPRDLFDLLLTARDPETSEGFSPDQLRDQIATMILAGHETTAVALFWTGNVIRQYNRLARDITDARGLDLEQTARLTAMLNVVVGDTAVSLMYAKYHYLFWRPVTAIDPSSVSSDIFGPTPGVDGEPRSGRRKAVAGSSPRLAGPSPGAISRRPGTRTSRE